jgi:hypothetical protein
MLYGMLGGDGELGSFFFRFTPSGFTNCQPNLFYFRVYIFPADPLDRPQHLLICPPVNDTEIHVETISHWSLGVTWLRWGYLNLPNPGSSGVIV